MIIYKTSEIHESESGLLLCPVNITGEFKDTVMMDFRLKYPDVMKKYRNQAEKGNICFGRMYIVKDTKKDKNICILPVKEAAEEEYNYTNIKTAIEILKNYLEKNKEITLGIPEFGSYKMSWNRIKSIIESELLSIENEITIHEKKG